MINVCWFTVRFRLRLPDCLIVILDVGSVVQTVCAFLSQHLIRCQHRTQYLRNANSAVMFSIIRIYVEYEPTLYTVPTFEIVHLLTYSAWPGYLRLWLPVDMLRNLVNTLKYANYGCPAFVRSQRPVKVEK